MAPSGQDDELTVVITDAKLAFFHSDHGDGAMDNSVTVDQPGSIIAERRAQEVVRLSRLQHKRHTLVPSQTHATFAGKDNRSGHR